LEIKINCKCGKEIKIKVHKVDKLEQQLSLLQLKYDQLYKDYKNMKIAYQLGQNKTKDYNNDYMEDMFKTIFKD